MTTEILMDATIFAVICWTAGYHLLQIPRLVLPALRTGVLQARSRTYSRTGQPKRFWGGICFWVGMSAAATGLVILSVHFLGARYGVW